MTRPTPGPWQATRSGQYVRRYYGTTGDGPKDHNICEVFPGGDDEQTRLNANLIAAAPELHDACDAIADLLEATIRLADENDDGSIEVPASELKNFAGRLRRALKAAKQEPRP